VIRSAISRKNIPVDPESRGGRFPMRGVMKTLNLKKVYALLGTRDIPGSEKELKILCTRITELVQLNGGEWVEENRQKLLDEWNYIVRQAIIS
jgi:hypothetical protein